MAGVPDKNAIKAGGFIVTALVLVGVIIWYVSARDATGGKMWTVAFNISDDISGLSTGSEVRVGGRPVGQVRDVSFSDDSSQILVKVNLPDDLPIRTDPAVRVQSTLTGIVWLNFTSLGDGDRLDPDNAVITGQAGTLSDLVQRVNEIGPIVEDVGLRVRDEVLPRLEGLLDDGRATTAEVTKAAKSVNQVLDEGGREDMSIALKNLAEASEKVPGLLEDAERLAGSATDAIDDVRAKIDDTSSRLTRVLEKAELAAEDVVQAAEDTRESLATVRGLLAGNRGKVNAIVTRLSDTARTLDLASSEIRRSPWRLLYKPSGEQVANMNLYDAARQFAEGANALQDAAIALEGVTNDPAADTAEVARILDELRQSFEAYDRAQTDLFRRIRD